MIHVPFDQVIALNPKNKVVKSKGRKIFLSNFIIIAAKKTPSEIDAPVTFGFHKIGTPPVATCA